MKGKQIIDYIMKSDMLNEDVCVTTSIENSVVVLEIYSLTCDADNTSVMINCESIDNLKL